MLIKHALNFLRKIRRRLRSREKVFGIGMFKTGTTSLTEALKVLGYKAGPCGESDTTRFTDLTGITAQDYVKWPKLAAKLHQSDHWPMLLSAARESASFADGPWLFLYQEFDQAFPGNKFILTLRKGGGEACADSDLKMYARREMGIEVATGLDEEGLREMIIDRYEGHNAAVREYFKDRPNDLLEICFEENDEEANWRLLTDFLGKPSVPTGTPFPRKNVAPS